MPSSYRTNFERAYELAYFIHVDEQKAKNIATQAIRKLSTASEAQFKRYYYQPTGRGPDPAPRRNKVTYQELHLLQRLVYLESSLLEKVEEAKSDAVLSQKTMLIRFLAYLVRNTMRRNSFYVALGMARLLRAYTTQQTMELLGFLTQDPERVPDDHYFRSRKKKLMKEIMERFGDKLRIVRGYRGEQRFESHDQNEDVADFVDECLDRFTPWDSPCVSSEIDVQVATIKAFRFEDDDPDEEHPVELNRIHTLLHPPCFEKLIRLLGFSSPRQQLLAPVFHLGHMNHDDPGSGGRTAPKLAESDFKDLDRVLAKDARERRNASRTMAVVKADGHEVGRIERGESLNLSLDGDVELLEFFSQEGVLLNAFLIDDWSGGALQEAELRLADNWALQVKWRVVDMDESDRLSLELNDLAPTAARIGLWARLKAVIFGEGFKLSVVGPIVAIIAIAFFLFVANPDALKPSPQTSDGLISVGSGADQTGADQTGADQTGADQTGNAGGGLTTDSVEIERTRGLVFFEAGLPLDEVRVIYVDHLGSEAQALRELLIDKLQNAERFSVPEDRDQADAVLKILPALDSADTLTIALVNASGTVLWSVEIDPAQSTMNSAVLADELFQGLLKAFE